MNSAAMAIPDQRVNLVGDEVDSGQQADRAVALIFIAGEQLISERAYV